MPNVITQAKKPYDTVGYTLQLARTLVNDAAGPLGLAGDLLASSQPYTLVLLNSAWRKFQDALLEAGVESLVKEIVLPALTPVPTIDPSVSVWVTWDGYFDGAIFHSIDNGAPALPYDLILPSEVWERPSGMGSTFCPVKAWDGGLPEGRQGASMRWYEWRDDKLFFKGATVSTDIKLRYVAYQPDLDIADDTLIPIMRCARAIAYLIASEWARARGAPVADNFYAMAETEIEAITNRTARRKAFITYRRKAFGSC